jgi:hypothetical protein
VNIVGFEATLDKHEQVDEIRAYLGRSDPRTIQRFEAKQIGNTRDLTGLGCLYDLL